MPNMTISVDSELYSRMKEYGFISWSAVGRIAFKTMVEVLETEADPKLKFERKLLKLMLEIMK